MQRTSKGRELSFALSILVLRNQDADAAHSIGLLRTRSKRPSRSRATENYYELASFHVLPQNDAPCQHESIAI
jgi:hypothetical protein